MDLVLVVIIVAVVVVVALGALLLGRRSGRTGTLERDATTTDATTEAPPGEKPDTRIETAGTAPPEAPPTEPEVEVVPELTLRERFAQRLTRTRNVLATGVLELFGAGVTDEAWEGLEEALISADVGVEASLAIVEDLRQRAREQGVTDAEGVVALLKDELKQALGSADRSLARTTADEPTVWMLTGVNGTGKTTTIGKLAAIEQREGRTAVLAAADTFRAAAADQLERWGERADARVVRKEEGADPASVAYDGYMAAKATDADVLIIDTAGRLHNRRELMDELSKVKRVVEKQSGPMEEILLVLDATTGQNGIQQARAFLEAVEVTGLVLTKLDGSSKGGIVVAVQRELDIPVKLVGVGEEIDDLTVFDPDAFVDGLFADVTPA
ncbi:MAG: signal recognition particle-docking protein FtsY [Nitriliruptorales bacterium]|nr:signal recognition particle-docking protein FtsY [Nitriliruptorales bacterium]